MLAGIYSSFLIFGTTFGNNQAAKDASVNVLGFRGPFGAFVCAWGGAAMIASAPFDNWWHEAYGLDVRIVSPPHTLLAMGIAALIWGGILLIVGRMNRSEGILRRHLELMLLAAGGSLVVLSMLFKLEYTNRIFMHSGIFYLVSAIGLPLFWESLSIATGWRWARTIMAAIYTAFFLITLWTFPLFAAEPKLGPVYQQVTHMVPLHFPLLILAPAVVLDIAGSKMQLLSKWQQATIKGTIFVIVLMIVQWPFANFLMSPASRNWVFGTHYFFFFLPPNTRQATNQFGIWELTASHFWRNIILAFVIAIVNVRIGIVFGNWLRRLKR